MPLPLFATLLLISLFFITFMIRRRHLRHFIFAITSSFISIISLSRLWLAHYLSFHFHFINISFTNIIDATCHCLPLIRHIFIGYRAFTDIITHLLPRINISFDISLRHTTPLRH